MNTSGCTACCWLLCLQYICVVLNHLASPTLQGICPVQALEGTTPDISFLLHFSFYEPVYYRIDSSEPDLNFPSSSNEKKGYWVGFADNQGDSLTWRILTEDTQKIIIRSGVHLKSLIGMPYAHSLHGHPHPASRTLSMSPPGMELLHIPRITSRTTLSLEILFSTSPDAVKLLQQTPSSLAPLLLMMVQPCPIFLWP